METCNLDEVTAILMADLKNCAPQQIAVFWRYFVEPYLAPIVRYGIADHVVVVAQRSPYVIYWEDVEGGFNVSPLGPGARVLEHSCIRDDLGVALNRLLQSRERFRARPLRQDRTVVKFIVVLGFTKQTKTRGKS